MSPNQSQLPHNRLQKFIYNNCASISPVLYISFRELLHRDAKNMNSALCLSITVKSPHWPLESQAARMPCHNQLYEAGTPGIAAVWKKPQPDLGTRQLGEHRIHHFGPGHGLVLQCFTHVGVQQCWYLTNKALKHTWGLSNVEAKHTSGHPRHGVT